MSDPATPERTKAELDIACKAAREVAVSVMELGLAVQWIFNKLPSLPTDDEVPLSQVQEALDNSFNRARDAAKVLKTMVKDDE